MSNKEAFAEFARGAAFTISVMGVVILLIAMIGVPEQTSDEKFKIVDSYNGCDVVRYTDPSNHWNYLLDCSRVK